MVISHSINGFKPLANLIVVVAALAWFLESPLFAGEAQAGDSLPATATSTPARKPAQTIFVTNSALDSLSVFPIGSDGDVRSLFTQTFLSSPVGITYWKNDLYVANSSSPYSITAYPAIGGRRPSPIININGEKTQLVIPVAVALDSAGNIYVANQGILGGAPPSVTIYHAESNGDVAPIARIAGPKTGLRYPQALTLDTNGNIYVVNDGSVTKEPDSITIYASGSNGNASPVRVIAGSSTELVSPKGIAVDSSGNIFVTSRGIDPHHPLHVAILIYGKGSNGNVAPITSVDGDCVPLRTPAAIALDSANVYVTNPWDSGVVVFPRQVRFVREQIFPPISTAPGPPQCLPSVRTISGSHTGMDGNWGIAVDSLGGIYVTNSDADNISVFKAGITGNTTPSRTIADPDTGIANPLGIALDSDGNIYVANVNSEEGGYDSVTVYPAGSSANTAPVATISSGGDIDKTGLNYPDAIAVDRNGRIFVANEGGSKYHGTITVYPPGSKGNVRPSATIGGNASSDNTGLNDPVGLGFDSANNLYVLNAFGGPDGVGSITVYPFDANRNVAPKLTIANGIDDRSTRFESPTGMALDSAGNIYVTNVGSSVGAGSDSITIYAAGSSGGVAPIATISGPKTALNLPHGIGIDAKGKIYVSNDGSNNKGVDTVTVYAPGSSGDAKPIATISGPHTGLGQPGGLAIGP